SPSAQVVLAGIVRSVGQPEADDRGADLLCDLDGLAAVVERLRANTVVRVAQASEPVRVVAEEIRIDRPDPEASVGRIVAERRPVVDPIPGNVQRDRRAATGQAVDECGIVDPLPDGAGGARPWEDVKARARVSIAPGR